MTTDPPVFPRTLRNFVFALCAMLVLAIVVIAGFNYLRFTNQPTVVLTERNGAHDYSPIVKNGYVSREQYAAFMLRDSTTLAKQEFVGAANGCTVEWTMAVNDVRTAGDELQGSFRIPVQIRDRSASRRSTEQLSVTCMFSADHRESLLKLRKKQVVTVRGKLVIARSDSESALIRDATLTR